MGWGGGLYEYVYFPGSFRDGVLVFWLNYHTPFIIIFMMKGLCYYGAVN